MKNSLKSLVTVAATAALLVTAAMPSTALADRDYRGNRAETRNVTRNVNRTVNRNVTRNVNRTVNRNVTRNVNRTVNRNVTRNVNRHVNRDVHVSRHVNVYRDYGHRPWRHTGRYYSYPRGGYYYGHDRHDDVLGAALVGGFLGYLLAY